MPKPTQAPKAHKQKIKATIPEVATTRDTASVPNFDTLPDSAFIRESQLVQSPKRPDRPAPLPFSAPTLWRKVKDGSFPKPHKLSTRVTAWKVLEVREWMNAQAAA